MLSITTLYIVIFAGAVFAGEVQNQTQGSTASATNNAEPSTPTSLVPSVASTTNITGVNATKTEATTVKPEATTVKLEATTVKLEATTVKPEATTVKPEATSVKPEATTVKPEATTVKPEATTVKPEATTVKPAAATVKPEVTTVQSVAGAKTDTGSKFDAGSFVGGIVLAVGVVVIGVVGYKCYQRKRGGRAYQTL